MSVIEIAVEKHYTPNELADIWKVAPNTIRAWFEDEPDVLIDGEKSTLRRRSRRLMRIPESVAIRVHRRKRDREQ